MDAAPSTPQPDARGFPVFTVAATLAVLFLFLGAMLYVYRKAPNYLDEPKTEQKADPVAKLKELKSRNDAVLAGSGAKMSVPAATKELLPKLVSEKERLPFPIPEPAVPAADPKKK